MLERIKNLATKNWGASIDRTTMLAALRALSKETESERWLSLTRALRLPNGDKIIAMLEKLEP